jgi:hypothetical protein
VHITPKQINRAYLKGNCELINMFERNRDILSSLDGFDIGELPSKPLGQTACAYSANFSPFPNVARQHALAFSGRHVRHPVCKADPPWGHLHQTAGLTEKNSAGSKL